MGFMGNRIKIFEEGTEYISKKDLNSGYGIVVLPHSLKRVENLLFYGNGSFVIYVGKMEELEKVLEDGTDMGTPCVECADGSKMLHV